MRAGRLDRRITIQTLSRTSSASGAQVETWSNLGGRRPASMAPVKGDEKQSEPQTLAVRQIEFRVRYAQALAELNSTARVIYPALSDAEAGDAGFQPATSRIHDVQVVHEIGRREGQSILTLRRGDTP